MGQMFQTCLHPYYHSKTKLGSSFSKLSFLKLRQKKIVVNSHFALNMDVLSRNACSRRVNLTKVLKILWWTLKNKLART